MIIVVVRSYLDLWCCSSNYRPAECSGSQVVRGGMNRNERSTKDNALLGAGLVYGYVPATSGPDIIMISSVGLCVIEIHSLEPCNRTSTIFYYLFTSSPVYILIGQI